MSYRGLPDYIDCPDCEMPHFLTFNRDRTGHWCAGYVDYVEYGIICPINEADTLDEAVMRLRASMERNGYANEEQPS